jgi:Predicted nucleic acid-binding protein, contains PIN domain
MTLTIVDSTILIDAIRDREAAVHFLVEAVELGPVWSSVAVRTEVLVGALPGEEARLVGWFERIEWQEVTIQIADLAARLGAPYRRSHRIGTVDLILAATAIELGGSVATLNVRDFPMFPGLQPPY